MQTEFTQLGVVTRGVRKSSSVYQLAVTPERAHAGPSLPTVSASDALGQMMQCIGQMGNSMPGLMQSMLMAAQGMAAQDMVQNMRDPSERQQLDPTPK